MVKFFQISAFLASVALLIGVAPRANAADAKGSITGVVTGIDGKAASGVSVKLFKASDVGGKHANKPANLSTAIELAKGEKGEKHAALKETTTDEKGAYTFADVDAGDYTIFAGSKDAGMARGKVTVSSGKVTQDLSLKAHEKKKAA